MTTGPGRAATSGPAAGDRRPGGPSRRSVTWWTGLLFLIGSACFGLASVPALAEVVPTSLVGGTYFVGSIFFTSAATLQAATAWRDHLRGSVGASVAALLRSGDVWAGMVQLVGTVWFNLNTFDALDESLTVREANLRVWTPDAFGSICFLVSSYIAVYVVCRRPWCWCRHDRDWVIAQVNLLGSVFFGLSAIAAFTLPDTGDLLDASVANSGTLLGAVCFFIGAWLLMLPPRPPSPARRRGVNDGPQATQAAARRL